MDMRRPFLVACLRLRGRLLQERIPLPVVGFHPGGALPGNISHGAVRKSSQEKDRSFLGTLQGKIENSFSKLWWLEVMSFKDQPW